MTPFFDGGWGVFNILVRLTPVVTVSPSRETLIAEQLVHRVSRVYIYIYYMRQWSMDWINCRKDIRGGVIWGSRSSKRCLLDGRLGHAGMTCLVPKWSKIKRCSQKMLTKFRKIVEQNLFPKRLKPISSQTHPGCGHLTLKTSRKSFLSLFTYNWNSPKTSGDQHLKNMVFHIFFIFFLARLEWLATKLVCARLFPAACPPRWPSDMVVLRRQQNRQKVDFFLNFYYLFLSD